MVVLGEKMFGVTDLKKGTLIQLEGIPYRVTDYSQKQMGRGGSIVNVKLKSLVDGRVLDRTFKGAEKIESADVESRAVQLLYSDSDIFYFMDQENFEQFEVPEEIVAGSADFLTEGRRANLEFFDGKIINVDMPKNVDLEVTYTESVVQGDTTSSVVKDATLETGRVIKVPAFIKIGDLVSVDTATGAYRERVKG